MCKVVFFQRQMRPTTLVVFEVALQNSTQPSLMEDNDVIQAFAPNGTNQPFDIGILPRCGSPILQPRPKTRRFLVEQA